MIYRGHCILFKRIRVWADPRPELQPFSRLRASPVSGSAELSLGGAGSNANWQVIFTWWPDLTPSSISRCS